MNSTDDLIVFLRARLDEDEQVAQSAAAANPGSTATRWSAEKVDRKGETGWQKVWAILPARVKGIVLAYAPADILPKVATHIVRHDPDRVLREVEAKRRLVDWHTNDHDLLESSRPTIGCRCYDGWPCTTLRLLALPYADHPDYREEWRP